MTLDIRALAEKAVRWMTAWAWRHEHEAVQGMIKLKELHLKGGAMEAAIDVGPEMCEFLCMAFGRMVMEPGCQNYVECKLVPSKPTDYQWITVTVQRGDGKTPHQKREEAERDLAELRRALKPVPAGGGA